MKIKQVVTTLFAVVMFSLPLTSFAQPAADAEVLLRQLAVAEDDTAAARLEKQLIALWSRSGSASMDLLLRRGRDALERSDFELAAGHFGALTDHAPEFAEGWNGLAVALYNLDQYGPAMDALEHVLALNPDHFGALRGVAAIHEQTGQPGLAYRANERVLDLRPHDAAALAALARLERQVKGPAL